VLKMEHGMDLPPNLPAGLLGHRPDIVAQRWRVEAAGKEITVAKARFYPDVNLVAAGGVASFGFSRMFTGENATGEFGPAISLPIFEGGRLRGNLRAQSAAYDVAVEAYNSAVINAFHEVADQVTSLRSLDRQLERTDAALASAQTANDQADEGARRRLQRAGGGEESLMSERHHEAPPEDRQDSFSEVDKRIEGTRRRLRGYPQEQVRLARLIIHVQKRQNELTNLVLKRYDLNYVTYTALMMMYGADDQTTTPSELSGATGEKPTNITRICDELLDKGLIERYPSTEDRRRVVLRLTRKGERLVEQFQPELWDTLERIFGGFNGGEMRQLSGLLRAMLARLDQDA
jgi:MarR family transcriptional repressor of emrRAB